jgi:hypothetical protein
MGFTDDCRRRDLLTATPGALLLLWFGVNECNEEGRDEFPEACIDAPGVDLGKIHEAVGAAALKFFDAHLQGSCQDEGERTP